MCESKKTYTINIKHTSSQGKISTNHKKTLKKDLIEQNVDLGT